MRVARASFAALVALALALAPAAPAAATAAALVPTTAAPAFPDDPADPIRQAEYWLDSLGIRAAWQTTRGAGQTIAIIDTGIGAGPPEFAGAVVGGTDVSGSGSSDGRTPVGAVDANHGSWVASLAAGRGTGDGTGMIGVAPEASLLSISLGFGQAGRVPFVEQVATAITWAVDQGATVINLSFTTNTLDWDPLWDEAFQYAFDNDVVIVVAAGNRGSGTTLVGAPATIPGVLTVGGVDPSGAASVEASTQGITIGVSAPSEELLGVSADGRIVRWSGTSGAAPIVAGVAALVRAAHPRLDLAGVVNRLVQTATPAPAASARPDPLYGYGIVNAQAAVEAEVAPVSANPMGDLAEWIRLYRRADVDPQPEQTDESAAEIPPLPPADPPSERASALLPSADSLRYGTLPLVAGTVAGILVALGVTAAVRRIRSARTQPRSTP
ncbi:S8 family serine peptidase [Microbacterium limosum]|uniref:S8 family serine peptidase n=1 Tax=Microbacterium limosum TaxID=3079935 RepID=A0AAU0MF50_9MICO|nr:S8 family serine peptidase [Microbacterium sp. Y20]WOQ68941.1 S8 family serine peptidase [Microbacterium sp. Y20]